MALHLRARATAVGSALAAGGAASRDRLGGAGTDRPRWPLLFDLGVRSGRHFFETADLGQPGALRARFATMMALLPGRLPRGVRTGPFRGSSVSGLWYRARGGRRDGSGRAPVIIYLHGGGYVFGSSRTAAHVASRLCLATAAEVLAPDYRLAPERPCPAALDDVLSVYRDLLASGVAPERLALAGDSAGGGLAAATLLALREAGEPLPAAAALLSPWVDLAAEIDPTSRAARLDVLTPPSVPRFATATLGGLSAGDWRASPAVGDLAGLPPLLVHVGALEILRPQVEAFARTAGRAGTEVTLEVADDMVHGWHYFAAVMGAAREAVARVATFLGDRLP